MKKLLIAFSLTAASLLPLAASAHTTVVHNSRHSYHEAPHSSHYWKDSHFGNRHDFRHGRFDRRDFDHRWHGGGGHDHRDRDWRGHGWRR
jgi:hypothetical protein